MENKNREEDFYNPVTEVGLRRRSTPYEFQVSMIHGGKTLGLYRGKSYNYALSAYWQAVSTLRFLGSPGKIGMEITKTERPFGGFSTELESGRVTSLHKPSGDCIGWTTRGWSGGHIAEKLIATVPGTLGLPKLP